MIDTQILIRIQAMADRVVICTFMPGDARTIEMEIVKAEALLAHLALAVAQARAFEPGAKSFIEWSV